MLDQHIIELINADIDGELSPNELRELEAVFESSPEAVQYRVELLELNGALGDLPDLDPPASLTHRILDQVQLLCHCEDGTNHALLFWITVSLHHKRPVDFDSAD